MKYADRERKRQVRKNKRILLSICSIIVVMTLGIYLILKSMESQASKITAEKKTENTADQKLSQAVQNMNSRYMLLADLEDGRQIIQSGADERIYPASLTKIMTVLISIENLPDLNEWIPLREEMVHSFSESGASMAGFYPGESVRAEDLLYAAMLTSGAEATAGLAERTAGSQDAFTVLMNQKAAELGMKDTHYTNPTGLHDPEQYTTLNDVYTLLSTALGNDTFREVFYTMEYSIAETSYWQEGIHLRSTLLQKLDMIEESLTDGVFLGGKTGTTDEAGLCLASAARIRDRDYLLITAKADYTIDGPAYNVIDAVNIYNSINE